MENVACIHQETLNPQFDHKMKKQDQYGGFLLGLPHCSLILSIFRSIPFAVRMTCDDHHGKICHVPRFVYRSLKEFCKILKFDFWQWPGEFMVGLQQWTIFGHLEIPKGLSFICCGWMTFISILTHGLNNRLLPRWFPILMPHFCWIQPPFCTKSHA